MNPPGKTQDRYAHMELAFSPNVELISLVRNFVKDFYDRVLGDSDLTWRLALATHELLENAVKFATDNNTRLFVEVEREGVEVRVAIVTRNRAEPDQVAALRELFAEMNSSGDPEAYYQTLMRRSSKKTVGSGLGLGRIRAEAMLAMDYTITGDLVELRAQGRHQTRQEARA